MLPTSIPIQAIIDLAKMYQAKRLILFGSAAEHPETAHDIDLACDGIEGWQLYEFGAKLEETLNMPVDIVPLHPPTRFTRYIEARGRILL
jgi:predicted nucleotidyltransferase